MRNINKKTVLNHLKQDNCFFFYLYSLIIISLIIISYKIQVQMTMGPMWDAFDFLANAKYFAGQGFGYIDPNRPPFLSVLTSLIFRMGYDSEIVIFIVDGVLFFIGVIGLYLFFNLRFKPILSFIGSLIYCSFPVILLWAGAGYSDVASTSLSIWTLYLIVLAVKRNNKYYYLSFPIFALAFFTRFPSVIIIFPLILYIMITNHLKDIKEIIMGIFISLLISIPFLSFFHKIFANPLLPLLSFYGTTVTATDGPKFAYNPDDFFYIKNFIYSFINLDFLNNPTFIVKLLFILLAIFMVYVIILGIYIYIRRILTTSKLKSSLRGIIHIKTLLVVLAVIMLIFTFYKENYLFSILFFSIICFLLFKLLNNHNLKYFDLDMLFILWFFSFLIFNSIFDVKVIRYFIPMAPAIAYFTLIGLNEFIERFNFKLMNINIKNIIYFIFIVSLLISTFHFIFQLEHDPIANGQNFKFEKSLDKSQFKFTSFSKPFSGELYFETYNTHESFNILNKWFENYDPDYKKKIIYSDYFWPHLRWYLKTEIGVININNIENSDINDFLKNSNVDYYVTIISEVELQNYVKIAEFKTNFGKITVYQRNS